MEINSKTQNDFIPTEFITVYTKNTISENKKYLEIGKINEIDGKYFIGSSSPVDKDFLIDLCNNIKVNNFKALKFKTLIPDNVLYFHSEDENPTIIWINKSGPKTLYFSKEIGIQSAEYEMPNILFVLKNNDLFSYRINNVELINNETEIYYLPLPNIYSDSKVCLGNSKLKKAKSLNEIIDNFEKLFYNTEFNALHYENFFDKNEIYLSVVKEKNMCLWPKKLSKIKNFKKLLNEVS